MCAYRKAILTIGMQLYVMSLRTIWSISFPFGVIKCQSGIDFYFTSEHAIYLQFMNKISVPSPVFAEKRNDESETLQSIHARMSTRG